MLDDALFIGAKSGAVIRRHEHQHRRAGRCRFFSSSGSNTGTEVTAGDDNRDAPGNMRQAEIHQRIALVIREQELLGIVGEDADAIDPLVDHAIEHAVLTVEVELARFGKRRRRNWKRTSKRCVIANDHPRILPIVR